VIWGFIASLASLRNRSFFRKFLRSQRSLGVELSYFVVPITLFVLSLAFLGMAMVRYSDDEIRCENRLDVRSSLLAYAIHPIPLLIAVPFVHSIRGRGTTFLLAVLLPSSGLLLAANVYFGFRSEVTAGRRAATAGICILIAFFTGGLFPLFSTVR